MNLKKDLIKLFNKLLKLQDDIIVFQTDTLNLSLNYKKKPYEVAKLFLNLLEKKFKNKTVLLPAFSNDLVFKKKIDISNFNIYTGIIPKIALKRGYFKTFSALHSFLVKGDHIKELKNLKQQTTWGKDSVFEWLEIKNARWVAMNLEWNRGCAFAHRSEELSKVPYRFYKIFRGKIYNKKKYIGEIKEKKYSTYKKLNIFFKADNVFKYLEKYTNNFFINKSLYMRTALTQNITKVFCKALKKNKFSMVGNKNEIKSKLNNL